MVQRQIITVTTNSVQNIVYILIIKYGNSAELCSYA